MPHSVPHLSPTHSLALTLALAEPYRVRTVGASINAAALHARKIAIARRDGSWKPSGDFTKFTFSHPAPGTVGTCGEHMVAGCQHILVDWREVNMPD